MAEHFSTPLYKLKPKVRVPFVKDFVIESIDKKAWTWLIKVLNINYEAELFAVVESDDTNYIYYDNDNPNGKSITAEEANTITNENYIYNSKILERIYKYNIPIYTYTNYPNDIIKNYCAITTIDGMYVISAGY